MKTNQSQQRKQEHLRRLAANEETAQTLSKRIYRNDMTALAAEHQKRNFYTA